MLELGNVDLDELASVLADQNLGDEHRYFLDPETAEIMLWTPDGGLDGETPVDLDDVDLVAIESLPSYVWYQDMADFTELVSDEQAARRLARALHGRGAFRRFRNELHEEYPHLLSAWNVFRDNRAACRAVNWLHDESLISQDARDRFLAEHPDPDMPGVAGRGDSLSEARLDELVAAAVADRHDEKEQLGGLFSMIQGNLAVPFSTRLLGVEVTVDGVELGVGGIAAVCHRDGMRQAIGILDLPLPEPAPEGAQWIEAYRHWTGRG